MIRTLWETTKIKNFMFHCYLNILSYNSMSREDIKWSKEIAMLKWANAKRKYCMAKALYGYNYSGKFLYLDWVDFLQSCSFETMRPLVCHWSDTLGKRDFIFFLRWVNSILAISSEYKLIPPLLNLWNNVSMSRPNLKLISNYRLA